MKHFPFVSVLSLLVTLASAKGYLGALGSGHPTIAAWRRRAQQGTIDPSTLLPTEGDFTPVPTTPTPTSPDFGTPPPTEPVLVGTAPPTTITPADAATSVPGTSPPVDAPNAGGGAAKFCYMVFQMAGMDAVRRAVLHF